MISGLKGMRRTTQGGPGVRRPSLADLVPRMMPRLVAYWVTVYRRTWRGSVTTFLMPFLYLASMGVGLGNGTPVEGVEALEPGDMVLLYTDGLTEARRPGGDLFSVERLAEFIEREAANGQAAPETLRRLREAIIERGEGALRYDASAVLVEWRRGTHATVGPQTV